jgi:hypothetical protein
MLGQIIRIAKILINPVPERDLQMEWNSIRHLAAETLGQSSANSSETARKYVRACVKDSSGKIRSAAIEYLKYLHPLTESKHQEFIGFLSDPKQVLSLKGTTLRTEVVEFIKNTYATKAPKNIPFISGSVFYDINEGAFNIPSPSAGVAARDPAASAKVRALIQDKIISSNETYTKTIAGHISTCTSSEKIKKIAIRFFDSLLSMTEPMQRQTLLELGISNLSGSREIVLEFRSAGKEVLCKAQKIPYILLLTLQKVNTSTFQT